jgi:3-dehydroquinate dehydratase-2
VKKNFLVISGPNLNLLGTLKTSIYGEGSLEDIHRGLQQRAKELNVSVECKQFNSEGAIVDCLQEAPGRFDGVIINAGALAHYSYALRSAIGATLERVCPGRGVPAQIGDSSRMRRGYFRVR